MERYIFAVYSFLFQMFGAMEEIAVGTFVAALSAVKREKIETFEVEGFGLDVELGQDGMCLAPDPEHDDPGSQVSLYPLRQLVSASAGFTKWLLNAKDIPCNCQGLNQKCPRCQGTGTAKDRYVVKQPTLPIEAERTTVIAVLLDQIRNIIKAGKYNYMVFCPKGNPSMYLMTMDALRELVGNLEDGKAIKRAGYFAGYSLFENTSKSHVVRVAILKDEDWLNGQLQWNVKMALNLDAHAIRLLSSTILKGSARSISQIELEWAKNLLGIKEQVDGFATHELVKRADSAHIVADHDEYYVIEFDIADLMIVNPPLKPGFPGLGLSLWKYGKLGIMMNKMVIGSLKANESVRLLKEAMGGYYTSECKVLGVKMPEEGSDKNTSQFHFPIPTLKDSQFEWRNPKDKNSWDQMWKRFYRYLLNNILKIEVDGLKSIVASCSIVVDAYECAYHLQHEGEQVAFTILPDSNIRTELGKISMEAAIENKAKGFVLQKDPASSIRHFIHLTPIGAKSMLRFLVTGLVDIYEDDTPILCGKGSVIISSVTMQERMCVQDFDGDQPKLMYLDIECCPPCPEPVDWVKQFVTKEADKAKVNLVTEQEQLEYYSNMMMTVVAARQAIAPMVLGSLAGYIEMVVRAFQDKRLDGFPVAGWDQIQRLLSAIAEIYAIKKEKSMADAADKKTGWLWVDMFLDLFVEAKDMIPLYRESTPMEKSRSSLIRNLIRPSGEILVEDETGEMTSVKSSAPYDILKTLCSNARKAKFIAEGIRKYFPSIELTSQFDTVTIQRKMAQPVNTKATKLSEMHSDVQKQKYIFDKMIDNVLSTMGLTKTSGVYLRLDKAAREFITEIREGMKEVMSEFPDTEDSIEKTAMIHESQAYAMQILIDEGLCKLNPDKPWISGESLDSDREFLFALLVGSKDMSYQSREREGERIVEDGRKSSFNKCTAEGIRRCIMGYFATVELLTLDDFYGDGDTRIIKEISGYRLPLWVGEDQVEVFDNLDTEQHDIL